MTDEDAVQYIRDYIAGRREAIVGHVTPTETWHTILLRALDASEEARQKAKAQRDQLREALEAQGVNRTDNGQWHLMDCHSLGATERLHCLWSCIQARRALGYDSAEAE